jgi:DNA mismatch endonuclease (patch repair protein)
VLFEPQSGDAKLLRVLRVADNLSKAQRSYAMSRIRSRGNSSTEEALIAVMRKAGISGWRRKSKLRGKPDFVLRRFQTVIFVDGCFWHGCRKCSLASKSNREYWLPKITGNVVRDRTNMRLLRQSGWKVVRIWEHDLKSDPVKCVRKIMAAIGPS